MKKLLPNDDSLLSLIHDYGINPNVPEIWIVGERDYNSGQGTDDEGSQDEPGVEHIMASRFIKNLSIARGQAIKTPKRKGDKKYGPILIHMKTCGGYWTEGMAIYDAIKNQPHPVTILNYTHARSMSSIILQAASRRIMMPNSYFMFHQGTTGAEGTPKQVESRIDFDKRDSEIMLDIYASKMKETGKKWKKETKTKIKQWLQTQMDSKEDVFLTPKQTIEYGFADEIFDGRWDKLP